MYKIIHSVHNCAQLLETLNYHVPTINTRQQQLLSLPVFRTTLQKYSSFHNKCKLNNLSGLHAVLLQLMNYIVLYYYYSTAILLLCNWILFFMKYNIKIFLLYKTFEEHYWTLANNVNQFRFVRANCA